MSRIWLLCLYPITNLNRYIDRSIILVRLVLTSNSKLLEGIRWERGWLARELCHLILSLDSFCAGVLTTKGDALETLFPDNRILYYWETERCSWNKWRWSWLMLRELHHRCKICVLRLRWRVARQQSIVYALLWHCLWRGDMYWWIDGNIITT